MLTKKGKYVDILALLCYLKHTCFFRLRKFLPSLLLLANGESITYSE